MYLSHSETEKAIKESLEEEVVPQTLSTKQIEAVVETTMAKLEDLGIIFTFDDDELEDEDAEETEEIPFED